MLCLYVLFLVYPGVSSVVLRHLICKRIDGEDWLLSDLRVECNTPIWTLFSFISYALILVYPIGIPAFFFYLMYSNRDNLYEAITAAKLGFLYGAYQNSNWWFEMVDMLHKVIVTSILAFFPRNFQIPMGMGFVGAYLIIILINKPYVRDLDDLLHILVQVEIMLLLHCAWIFHNADSAFNARDDLVLSITLIILCIFVLVVFLALAGLVCNTRCRRKLQKRRDAKERAAEGEQEEDVEKDKPLTGLSARLAERDAKRKDRLINQNYEHNAHSDDDYNDEEKEQIGKSKAVQAAQ
jgi:hypothetical protein